MYRCWRSITPATGAAAANPTRPVVAPRPRRVSPGLTSVAKVPAERIILFGESLGSGVAVELAARHPCRALVLMSAFTSLPDAAHGLYPLLPCRWLMRNRFENIAKLPGIHRPVFLYH